MRKTLSTTDKPATCSAATDLKPQRRNRLNAGKIVELLEFDSQMKKRWLRRSEAVLVGTDEVGRGCLAGPVVAAAVQIPEPDAPSCLSELLSGLDDSKKLSPRRREELSAVLTASCRYAIGEASVDEIERINILQASFLAMARALEQLQLPDSSLVLVDGNRRIACSSLRQILVVGGDGISASIAAASVIAKVHRDALMCGLHEQFPQYQWDSNKGYGSKEHCQSILSHGLTSAHRRSFCRGLLHEQLTILSDS